jgi:hypothetical protein
LTIPVNEYCYTRYKDGDLYIINDTSTYLGLPIQKIAMEIGDSVSQEFSSEWETPYLSCIVIKHYTKYKILGECNGYEFKDLENGQGEIYANVDSDHILIESYRDNPQSQSYN